MKRKIKHVTPAHVSVSFASECAGAHFAGRQCANFWAAETHQLWIRAPHGLFETKLEKAVQGAPAAAPVLEAALVPGLAAVRCRHVHRHHLGRLAEARLLQGRGYAALHKLQQ